jgi:hypothetical protein
LSSSGKREDRAVSKFGKIGGTVLPRKAGDEWLRPNSWRVCGPVSARSSCGKAVKTVDRFVRTRNRRKRVLFHHCFNESDSPPAQAAMNIILQTKMILCWEVFYPRRQVATQGER